MPAERVAAKECVSFVKTAGTVVEHVRIDGSAAAGLLFWQCARPVVVDAVIARTMADGLHFANCQDARADHITTVDTGDDGVAFINYATNRDRTEAYPDATGGLATNLLITGSRSRGVCVGGQRGVTVRDVVIDSTVGARRVLRGRRPRLAHRGADRDLLRADPGGQRRDLDRRWRRGRQLRGAGGRLGHHDAARGHRGGRWRARCLLLLGDRLWIYDTRNPAAGYVVGAYGSQSGSLGTVIDAVDGGDVMVDNPSGLAVTRI